MTDLIFESGIGLLLVEASRGDGGNRPVVIPLPTSKNFACGSPLWGPSVLVFTNVLKKKARPKPGLSDTTLDCSLHRVAAPFGDLKPDAEAERERFEFTLIIDSLSMLSCQAHVKYIV